MERPTGRCVDAPHRRLAAGVAAVALAISVALGLVAPMWWVGASNAAGSATIFGVAVGRNHQPLKVTVSLFTSDWQYLRATTSSRGGVYRFSGLAPGTYWLQASDSRPAWDIKRLSQTDASASIGVGQSLQRDLVMKPGAFVTGKVRLGSGKPGSKAIIRVANEYGTSYETTADNTGGFAIGGLPGGRRYSLFAWDKRHKYAGKSLWLSKLKTGRGKNVTVKLSVKAGAYSGILRVNGVPTSGTIWATMVNRTTGQWWTAPIRNGDLSGFRGLYPGSYRLHLPATNQMLEQDLSLPKVRAGRTRLVRLDARPAPPPPPPATSSPSASSSASPSASASMSPSAPTSSATG